MIKSPYFLLLLVAFIFIAIPVSAYDFTLSVYGNANMDDIIDEEDITYLKGIISGVNEKTQFADANYDGIVNDDDISQIESIIAGDETKLTIVDCSDRIVTLNKPIDKIVTTCPTAARTVSHLGSANTIVGVDSRTTSNADKLIFVQAYPQLANLPTIGTWTEPSQEKILSLEPDVVFAWDFSATTDAADILQSNINIPVVCVNPDTGIDYDAQGGVFETWRIMGLILDQEDRAEELIKFSQDEFDQITKITDKIPEEDKPKVYLDFASQGVEDITWAAINFDTMELAGGKNVASDLLPSSNWGSAEISKEQLINWNPDIILLHGFKTPTITKEKIMGDPVLQSVNAIKNGQVYYIRDGWMGSDPSTGVAETYYMAKIFHPDDFADLNMESKGNEVLKTFYGADNLYSWLLHEGEVYQT